MALIDIVSIIGVTLSVLAFFGLTFPKLAKRRGELTAIAWFLVGFVVSRVIYPYFAPTGTTLPLDHRLIIGVITVLAVAMVVVALKREGTREAVWVALMCLFLLSANAGWLGKWLGIVPEEFRDDEVLLVVEAKERFGEFDRAIELLLGIRGHLTEPEQTQLDQHVQALKSKKAERLKPPNSDTK